MDTGTEGVCGDRRDSLGLSPPGDVREQSKGVPPAPHIACRFVS